VIGMQFEITDRAARLFASEFYTMIAEGKPVDAAVAEARLAIYADQNDVEWATPVLFLRVANGQLFDVEDARDLPRTPPPPPTETGPAPPPPIPSPPDTEATRGPVTGTPPMRQPDTTGTTGATGRRRVSMRWVAIAALLGIGVIASAVLAYAVLVPRAGHP